MEQVFIANPKGGCGKTTLSTQLAAYCANKGRKVLLVDHDVLKCSSDWLAARPQQSAKIECVVARVGANIESGDADWVIHDMPASWTLDDVQNILHTRDRVLIPVLSSPNDIKACLRFSMKLHRSGILESGIKAGFVANRVRPHTRYFEVLIEFLSRMELPLVAVLRDTQNYVRAMDRGLSIFDFPENKIRTDLDQWEPLLDWLYS